MIQMGQQQIMQSLLQQLLSNIQAEEPISFLLERLSTYTQQQLNSIILQLNCLASINPQLRSHLVKLCQDEVFYYKNKHILNSLVTQTLQVENKNLEERYNSLVKYQDAMDHAYINGIQAGDSEEAISTNSHLKQKRLSLKQHTHEFIETISVLSEETFHQIKLGLDVKEFFAKSLISTNGLFDNGVYPVVNYKNKLEFVKRIGEDSWYIKTKSRAPLVLNLGFQKFIYKNDTMLCNQMIARNIISFLKSHLSEININIKTYQIITFDKGALYQFISDSSTVSDLKKQHNNSLKQYFQSLTKQVAFLKFCESYAGFCIVQYVLMLTDRHNENIMIDKDGEIFHIDLGYVFMMKVGGKMKFESAPFKFTDEYKNLMAGQCFEYWRELLVRGFEIVVKIIPELMVRLKVAMKIQGLECFKGFSLEKYRGRFPAAKQNVEKFVDKLIHDSFNAFSTRHYDKYQLSSNGILY